MGRRTSAQVAAQAAAQAVAHDRVQVRPKGYRVWHVYVDGYLQAQGLSYHNAQAEARRLRAACLADPDYWGDR